MSSCTPPIDALRLVPDVYATEFDEFLEAWQKVFGEPITPGRAISQLIGFALSHENLIETLEEAQQEGWRP